MGLAMVGTAALGLVGAVTGLVNHANLEAVIANTKVGVLFGVTILGISVSSLYLIKNSNEVKN